MADYNGNVQFGDFYQPAKYVDHNFQWSHIKVDARCPRINQI